MAAPAKTVEVNLLGRSYRVACEDNESGQSPVHSRLRRGRSALRGELP